MAAQTALTEKGMRYTQVLPGTFFHRITRKAQQKGDAAFAQIMEWNSPCKLLIVRACGEES